MAFSLYSIDEAIDKKFIVTKTLGRQAKAGTLVHIMDASESSNGVTVDYRVTSTGQDFTVKFDSLKQFCSWAVYDTFIARYYEFLSSKDIQYYLKVTNRTVVSFCVPIILVCMLVIWLLALLVIKGTTGVVLGIVLSVVAAAAVFIFYKTQKSNILVKFYGKVSNGAWGIAIK